MFIIIIIIIIIINNIRPTLATYVIHTYRQLVHLFIAVTVKN